jgi:hypothetical protein
VEAGLPSPFVARNSGGKDAADEDETLPASMKKEPA